MARNESAYDLVLLDIWMPDTDGVSLLKEWSMTGLLTMPVIMMSGHATIDTAVEATRIGAFSFGKAHHHAKAAQGSRAGPAAQCAGSRARAPAAVAGKVVPSYVPSAYSAPAAASIATVAAAADAAPNAHQGFDLDRPLREARDGFEKAYFEFHLAREGGSMTRVAEDRPGAHPPVPQAAPAGCGPHPQ